MSQAWPLGERKARVGQAFRLVWQAPAVVAAATVPTATLHLPTGPVNVALANDGGQVEVTAVDARDTALLTTDATLGAVGDDGAAWLSTGQSGAFAVRVTDTPTATSARLAEPLPRTVTLGADPFLVSALWQGSIPAQANPLRNIRLSVAYVANGVTEVEDSIVHFVRSPFATGATTTDLRRYVQTLGMESAATQGLEGALEYGERSTALMVRQQLREQGLDEDAVRNPAAMRMVCLYLAAALLHDVLDSARADGLRTRAKDELMIAMESVSLDTNDDLTPDVEEQVTGGRNSWTAQPGVTKKTASFPLRSWGF